jgi:Tfp pilus assembly major pilin PilA
MAIAIRSSLDNRTTDKRLKSKPISRYNFPSNKTKHNTHDKNTSDIRAPAPSETNSKLNTTHMTKTHQPSDIRAPALQKQAQHKSHTNYNTNS